MRNFFIRDLSNSGGCCCSDRSNDIIKECMANAVFLTCIIQALYDAMLVDINVTEIGLTDGSIQS